MSIFKFASILSDPSWRRGAVAAAAAVGAILAGSVALALLGLLRQASALGGFGPWGVVAVLIASLGIGAGAWFRGRPGGTDAPGDDTLAAPIPPPIQRRPDPAPDLSLWEKQVEADVPALKARFSRHLEAEEFALAEAVLALIRGMGQEKWANQNDELLAYKRRQCRGGSARP